MTQNVYKLTILHLDHRPIRDKRITTHCALVSRALGAQEFLFSGIKDNKLIENVLKVNKTWGGDFKINYCENPLSFVKECKENGQIVIHLTMYGKNVTECIQNVAVNNSVLVIVSGSKVPKDYYELADYNVAIGNQPHSEVSAIALFLYFLNNDCLENNFKNGKIKIVPCDRMKKVINL